MTALDHAPTAREVPASGRLVAAAALALPPLILVAVALGLALRGGGVAPEQWQPVAIGLAASLLVLSAVGAIPRVELAAMPMLLGIGALLVWTGASMAWTASSEATFEHFLRLALLGGAAVVGLAYGARPRAALALAAGVALCGAIAASAIEVKLLSGSTEAFVASRLSWPINYANADAALVWLPLPALLAFAAAQPLRPLIRGGLAFFAALALATGLTAQSRGGAIALAGALVASAVIAKDRGRFGLTVLATVAPVAVFAPRLVGGDAASSASVVREHGQAALASALVAGILVCGLAMLDRRRRFPFGGFEGRVAAAAASIALVLVGAGFLTASGRPDEWVSARWAEFSNPTSIAGPRPGDTTHFGSGVSNRYDYWRVAWRTFEDDPIQGVGAGAFSVPWFRLRSIDENVTDAHSWQAGALAETGAIGLLVMAIILLFPLGRIRKARLGSGAWPIAAVALGGAGVYFVLHASLDWLFRIPAIALPGFVVLGALATGGGRRNGRMFAGSIQRAILATASALVLALLVPAYLSTAAVARGQTSAATSTQAALSDLEEAERLNPFAAEPLLVRAAILQAAGNPVAATAAAQGATERAPQNWAAWRVRAAAHQLQRDHVRARAALARATALNPRAVRRIRIDQ